MVIDALPQEKADQTWKALATLMGEPATPQRQAYLRDHTLVRRIESQHMDVDAIPQHRAVNLAGAGDAPLTFRLRKRQLPETLPVGWTVSVVDDDTVEVQCSEGLAAFIPETRQSRVQVAGQLPTGFDPEKLYASRSHPRGLAMTIFAASDALGSAGLSWETLRQAVAPDEIAVYASSGMSQLDQNGNGGMMQAALMGKRVSSKQLPLGLPQMPADFVNAYVLGSAGSTGANIGACATYLYNLRQGVDDIRSGRRRVVLVGCAEAPILPEIIEGYRTKLIADGTLNDKQYDIKAYTDFKEKPGVDKILKGIEQALQLVPQQRKIYGLVEAAMTQQSMNETAPKVPETTAEAAF